MSLLTNNKHLYDTVNNTVLVLVLVELKESDRWCSQRIRKPTTKQTVKFHKHCEVMNDLGDDTDGEGESGMTFKLRNEEWIMPAQ